jgi:ribonuclease E
LRIISPRQPKIVRMHKEEGPIFNKFGIEEQIAQIFRKKVHLRSGGYLFIDPTNALVAVDVNSGRSNTENALEETVFKVNMEAAAEVPRQLRLRDLGGLIVIDFIDMRETRHMREVERRLKEEIKKDKAKITVGRISRFGLLEMSRQHLGLNILHGSYQECPFCNGDGLVRSTETTALSYLRKIWLALVQKKPATVRATLPAPVASYLLNRKRDQITRLEQTHRAVIVIEGSPSMMPHEGHLELIPREAEDGGRVPENGERRAEDGRRKTESGGRKPDGGSRKSEAGGRMPE